MHDVSFIARSTSRELCIVTRVKHFLALLLVILFAAFAAAQDPAPPCRPGPFARALGRDGKTIGKGILVSPREAIRPRNLAWELPVAAATVALVEWGDQPGIDRIHNPTHEQDFTRATDIGVGAELGAGAIAWIAGCHSDNNHAANAAFTALAAGGYAQVLNLGIKEVFRRQYPYSPGSTGDFFARSRAGSFTSGHATTSFAFAAAIAHEYPHKPWVKWGSYALATAISVGRYPARKHYPSDILIGATVGYLTGTYIADHANPNPNP
ncbi:MAG TPA: phosphatase PAP2 family protein [Candidatus Koribacter sp.]|jgi:hypothetical protein